MKKRPRILVVGSFVMDQIAETAIFPHEGQTVLGGEFHKAPGGKGANQAVQAARLGADVTMVGKLGNDANGDEMLAACAKEGIHIESVLRDSKHPSGCSVIILEKDVDGQTRNRIIVLPGANMSMTIDEVSFLKETIGTYDLVMLQLEIPMAVNEYIAQIASAEQVPVMLNSAPSAPLSKEFLSNLTYISPNEHELYDLTGIKVTHEGKYVEDEDLRRAVDVLHNQGVKTVLVTLGNAGAALSAEKKFYQAPCAEGVVAVDPTAAGDSFVGAFCVGACLGWLPEEILAFSNHTAAITVSRMGAMPSLPRLNEVMEYLKEKGIRCPDTSRLSS